MTARRREWHAVELAASPVARVLAVLPEEAPDV
jgi:hypothetical protein